MPERSKGGARLDFITLAGLTVALAGIVGGLLIDGGKVKDVAQFTAALIVFGGTTGAVMVSTPLKTLKGAIGRLAGVLMDSSPDLEAAMEEVIGYAAKARKHGLVSLEEIANEIEDPFLRKALNLAVDGADLQEIRSILQLEIDIDEQNSDAEAKVFESAGGFAPTIGIIGAVLGLIQVMKSLANIDEVGHGIAVSFVATVYGVGSANLFFLPAANKIKARAHRQLQRKELILDGILGIVEGLNPKLIRARLEAFTGTRAVEEKDRRSRREAA
ncbi:MAG: flagellar motor protein [Bryobacterales bacterium]|nr:flagellar motor protein [Bryobacterales bacterium]MBV9400031.1 flagellar motor protein [Bryobacterales bacterium]